MKNITFRQSVLCAMKGLYFGLKTEKNYKYYLGINLAFFLLDFFYLQVDLSTWYAVILSSAGVYGMECVNTAVEHLSDFATKEQHPEIKVTKDLAAAGVLCFGIAFFLIQGIAIGKYFMAG